jgi:hypothetical protein
MNLNDNNIDKLFKDAANDAQSPDFNESYWTEMQAVLAQKKKAKKDYLLGVIWMFFAISSFATVSALLLYNPMPKQTNQSVLAENRVQQDKTKLQTTPTEKTDSDIAKAENISINELKESKAVIENENQRNLSLPKNNKELKQAATSLEELESKGDQAIAKKENNHSQPKSRGGKIEEENRALNSIHKESLHDNSSSDTSLDGINIINTNLTPKLVKIDQNLFDHSESIYNMPRRISAEHGFHLDLGLSFAEPYQGNTSSSNRFSLAGMYSLDYNNIIMRTGIGFTIERSSNLSVREESVIYSYSSTKYENILDYKVFTEVYVPFEFGYRFNNTTFGAGGQFNVLLGTRMSHIEKINNEVVSNRTLNNRTEGLNPLTGGAYIWIQQHLNARLMAGVRIGRNIGSRIAENEYLNNVSRPTPVFGQIYISYQLFRK